jgi:hypothetical protein
MRKPKGLNLSFRKATWPKKGDRLFTDDSDWWHNARLDLGGKGWESFACGYRQAADSLALKFLRNWQGNDMLIYPLVFLYRHYLELRLKRVIILGQKLLVEPISLNPKNLQNSHDLICLWTSCREVIEKLGVKGFWPKDSKEQLDNVGSLIKEFAEKDPDGINFRYPVTKDKHGGKPTLPSLNVIGVRNLKRVMRRLDAYFTAQLDGIDVFL